MQLKIAPIAVMALIATAGAEAGTIKFSNFDAIAAVPEASTWMMLILGFGLAGLGRRCGDRAVAGG